MRDVRYSAKRMRGNGKSTKMNLGAFLERWRQNRRDRRARALPAGYNDIVNLHRKGLVSVRGTGQSITEISVEIASRVREPLAVAIPHGTYFVSRGAHQNMVTRTSRQLVLQPLATARIHVPAACINAALPIPATEDRFDGVAQVPADLRRFLEAAENEDTMTVQAGVWALTDNYDRERIQAHLRMRQTYSHRDSSSRAGTTAFDNGPAISARQIDHAKAILDRLGIHHRL